MADAAEATRVIATISHGDVLMGIVSILSATATGLWFGGRWTSRIEVAVQNFAALNTSEHKAIGDRLDGHEKRISRVEDRVSDMHGVEPDQRGR